MGFFNGLRPESPDPVGSLIREDSYPFDTIARLQRELIEVLQGSLQELQLDAREVDMWIFQDRKSGEYATLGFLNGDSRLFIYRSGQPVLVVKNRREVSKFDLSRRDSTLKIVNPFTLSMTQPETLHLDPYKSNDDMHSMFDDCIYSSEEGLLLQLSFGMGEPTYKNGHTYDKAFLTNIFKVAVRCTIDASAS